MVIPMFRRKHALAAAAVLAILPGLTFFTGPAMAAVFEFNPPPEAVPTRTKTLPVTVFQGQTGGFQGEVVFSLFESPDKTILTHTIRNTGSEGIITTAFFQQGITGTGSDEFFGVTFLQHGTIGSSAFAGAPAIPYDLGAPFVSESSDDVNWVLGGGIDSIAPPGGGSLTPPWTVFDTGYKFGAIEPLLENGIGPTNSPVPFATISWFVFGAFDFSDYLQSVVNGNSRIAFQIQGFEDGGSSQALVTPVPGALPLFFTALAWLGYVGWRRTASV
ncbi:MAG: hypothetical protein EA406_01635 [Rhodospirillales bacterium]|nr:MAG: hypothetical protein EA406_01635 [Rhodospirillales bacterium]